MLSDFVSDPVAFVALATNVQVPDEEGVPVIAPDAASVSPGGRLPESFVQVIGVSPTADSDCE